MNKIIINVEDGLIQSVHSNEDINIEIWDWDGLLVEIHDELSEHLSSDELDEKFDKAMKEERIEYNKAIKNMKQVA